MDNMRKKAVILTLVTFLLLGIGFGKAQAGPHIKITDEAFLQIDFQTQLNAVWRDTGSGPADTSDTTDFYSPRTRLGFYGHMTDVWGFDLKLEYAGAQSVRDILVTEEPYEEFYIYEAFAFADPLEYFKIRAGKVRVPLSREGLEDCFDPLSVDRSLFIYTPFQRLRDIGLFLWGNIFDSKFQYKMSITEGRESGDAPKSSPRYTVRAHASLLDPEDAYTYKATYLGERKVLTLGAGFQYEPDVVYGNVAAKTLKKDYQAWTFDAFLEYPLSFGTFTISGAYLKTDFDDAYKGGDPDEWSIGIDGQKNGAYVKGGYLLPKKIGPGKVQFFGRYETWNFAKLSNLYIGVACPEVSPLLDQRENFFLVF